VALDVDVVQGEVGEFLHGPVREHDPRNDRVDEEDERVGDTGGDAILSLVCAPHTFSMAKPIPVTAFSAARAHHRAACSSSAAGGGNAPYLISSASRSHMERGLHTVPMAGIARNGSDRSAPMITIWRVLVFVSRCDGARGCA
jgi:hypothetical protein